MATEQLPEIRLYRIIRAFQGLQTMRVCSLDSAKSYDPNYLTGAWALLDAIEHSMRHSSDKGDQDMASMIRATLYPEWDQEDIRR